MYFPEQPTHLLNDTDFDSLRIHSLETFGTHDGPGIRMMVFVQGCQFRCLYCQNPDSIDIHGGSLVSIDELGFKSIKTKILFWKTRRRDRFGRRTFVAKI